MAYTQAERLISIESPLGADVLLLQGFGAVEAISRLFRFDLDLLSEGSVDFTKIIGQKVTASVAMGDRGKRYMNGYVSRFAQSGADDRFTYYRAEVVPWLWMLTRTTDCRIFQSKTVPQIIKKIFDDLQFSDYKDMLQGSYEPREYCVQYRETDFNFVSRLMEEEGIFYFFQHEQNKHTLILGDSPGANQECPNQKKARFEQVHGTMEKDDDVVTAVHYEQEFRPGKFSHTDYNFEDPGTSLMASANGATKVGGNDKYEIYDYPGEYRKKGEGERLAKVRIQELEADHVSLAGSSTCRAFVPGYRFSLTEHPVSDMNKAYVLTEVQSAASVGGYYTGSNDSGDESYSNQFTCIPYSVPFRPRRVTPRPTVEGPQTAVVTGKGGEEIYTDKYGRVKVQFHWDREGKKDENTSCWIRVSQPWGGKGWGAMWIPRIGQEVIVEHLEGDPDQPIITGRVYNAVQTPPYELPAHHTISTFMSRSSKGGSGGNYNEIRFEDNKGKEQIFINAEKDMDHRVENDSREFIGANRHLMVGANQTEVVGADKHGHVKANHFEKIDSNMSLQIGKDQMQTIGNDVHRKIGNNLQEDIGKDHHLNIASNRQENIGADAHLNIGANHVGNIGNNMHWNVGAKRNENVGADMNLNVGANLQENIGADRNLTVGANRQENIGSDMSLTVGANRMEQVGSDYSLSVSGDQKENIGGTLSVTVGSDHHEKAGSLYALETGQEIHLKGGMKVIIEGGMQVSLKVGGNFVDIGPAGVTIQGTLVRINSGGSAGSGSGASPKSPKNPKGAKSPDSPDSPKPPDPPKPPIDPKSPDVADDGSKLGKLN